MQNGKWPKESLEVLFDIKDSVAKSLDLSTEEFQEILEATD
jgi:energy-converting hydrogenase A subunit M